MIKKIKKVWARPIEEHELRMIVEFIAGRMSLTDLMTLTKTTSMGVYSLIARGAKLAYQKKFIREI